MGDPTPTTTPAAPTSSPEGPVAGPPPSPTDPVWTPPTWQLHTQTPPPTAPPGDPNAGAPTAPLDHRFNWPPLLGEKVVPKAPSITPRSATPGQITPAAPPEHDLRDAVDALPEGTIKAKPDRLRDWSATFTSDVYGPLQNAESEMRNLYAVARPGSWPEATSLDTFLRQAGDQIATDIATMQGASTYLSQALKAVADLQEQHESDRQRANAEFEFEKAVGRLQGATGAPSIQLPPNPQG